MADMSGLDRLAFLADVYRDASQQSQYDKIYSTTTEEVMPSSYVSTPPQNMVLPDHQIPILPQLHRYDHIQTEDSTPKHPSFPLAQQGRNTPSNITSLHHNSTALNVERKSNVAPSRKPTHLLNNPNVSSPTNILPQSAAAQQQTSVPPPPTAETPSAISYHAVYVAVYSGVPVYEMMCRNVAVMRRRADSFLNATQILKVAGIDKGRRTKILEREILVGEHEKVQGGYGKYQGTWIPFERGALLARQYNVEVFLRPLLEFQMPAAGRSDKTPTKEEYLAATRDKKPATSRQPSSSASNFRAVSAAINRNGESTPYMSAQSTPFATSSNTPVSSPPLRKKFRADEYSSSLSAQVDLTGPERHRIALMALFLNDDKDPLPELLTNPTPPADLDVDLVIDDQGHTALHWAAALGRLQILKLLVDKGADAKKLNNLGESALVRAVLVTNNFDNQTFPELLTILADAIPLVDNKHRTVLHHIAFTAGIKGRSPAAKYYMECVLERIGLMPGGFFATLIDIQDKHGDTALNIAARFGNRNLVEQLLDIGSSPDIENKAGIRPVDFGIDDLLHHGESLRAATAAIRALAESLGGVANLLPDVEDGPGSGSGAPLEGIVPTTTSSTSNALPASTDMVNTVSNIVNAVVGENGTDSSGQAVVTTTTLNEQTESRKRPRSPKAAEVVSGRTGFPPNELEALGMSGVKGKEVAIAVETMVEEMNSTFARDLKTKQEQLSETQSMLRELTRELAEVRRQNLLLRQQVSQLPELAQKTKVLELALSEETNRTNVIHGGMAGTGGNTNASNALSLTEMNSTNQPATIDDLRREVINLRSVVHTHEVEEQRLRESLSAMKTSASVQDDLYRKIIALCSGVPQNQINDEYVSNVLAAAETDKEIDTSTIASFMSRTPHHEKYRGNSTAPGAANLHTR